MHGDSRVEKVHLPKHSKGSELIDQCVKYHMEQTQAMAGCHLVSENRE